MSYWRNFALVAAGVIGIGYWAKRGEAKTALADKVTYNKLTPGQKLAVNLPTGSYSLDPSMIQPPSDGLPNGKVTVAYITGELDTSGNVKLIHAVYTPPSGVNVTLSFKPSQVLGLA